MRVVAAPPTAVYDSRSRVPYWALRPKSLRVKPGMSLPIDQ
jgi:hypothetical protein